MHWLLAGDRPGREGAEGGPHAPYGPADSDAPERIARGRDPEAVLFFATAPHFITRQILASDGGWGWGRRGSPPVRSLSGPLTFLLSCNFDVPDPMPNPALRPLLVSSACLLHPSFLLCILARGAVERRPAGSED